MRLLLFFLMVCPVTFYASNDPIKDAALAKEKGDISEALSLYQLIYKDRVESFTHEEVFMAIDETQNILMGQRKFDELPPVWSRGVDLAQQWAEWEKYFSYQSAIFQTLMSQGKNQTAMNLCKEMLAHPNIDEQNIMLYNKALGDCYRKAGALDSARFVVLKSNDIAKKLNDSILLCTTYGSLAGLEGRAGDKLLAIEYSKKAIAIGKEKLPYVVPGLYKQVADLFYDLKDNEKAKEYASLCIVSGEQTKSFAWTAHGKAVLGQLAVRNKDLEAAIIHFEASLADFAKANRFNNATISVLLELAKCHYNLGDNTKGDRYLEEAETKFKVKKEKRGASPSAMLYMLKFRRYRDQKNTKGMAQELSSLRALNLQEAAPKLYYQLIRSEAEYLEILGQHAKANSKYKRYYVVKDSMENLYRAQQVQTLEAKFLKAEQEKEIANLEFSNQLAGGKIKKQRRALFLGGTALVVLAGLLTWVYRLFKVNKKNKEQLVDNNKVIQKALEEKNTLLQEIHHRVKNNLQVVSSLLSLQSRLVTDEVAIDAINASKGRVQSMSLLHQNLYQDKNLKGVDMQVYFENLVENLFHTYKIPEDRIQFEAQIDQLNLDIDTVVPLGLITNELITNSLKHAFTEMEEGLLKLRLHQENDQLILQVTDNGKGLAENKIPLKEGSLGAKLIHSFAEKLDAQLTVDGSKGTKITLSINNYKMA